MFFIFINFSNFIFSLLIPPKATIFKFVFFDKFMNLYIPKDLLFFLNIGLKNKYFTLCFSLILTSFKLCADPRISNFFFW